MAERPAIVHLIGFPGTGKLTIATALAGQAAPARQMVVVDNHLTSNAFLAVIGSDGVAPVPAEVWDPVREVRAILRRTIRDLSPPELSFVFTNVLLAEEASAPGTVGELRRLAEQRDSTYLPVCVHCDPAERRRRVVAPGRRHGGKWVDADGVDDLVARHDLFRPEAPHRLDLDVTSLRPVEAATAILSHLVHATSDR